MERNLQRFWWVLKDRKRKELIYHGDVELANEAISPKDATIWYSPNSVYMREIKHMCFGELEQFYFPILEQEETPENAVNITWEFVDFLAYMASLKILKEKNFTIWKSLIKDYELREERRPEPFAPLQYFRKTTVMSTAPTGLGMTESLQEVKELCAKKEFLDGLIKFRPMEVKGKVIEDPYETIHLPTQNTTVHGSYTTALRYMLFGSTRYHNKIKPGETLQPRQWSVKLHEGWITAVIAPRRWGKTFYVTSRIIEEFTRDKQHPDKPVRVLFIGINRKKNKTVINYILSMSQDLMKHGYFERVASEQTMFYKEKWKKRGEDKILGMIEFIGARDEDAGVGDYADLIVIDECERISPKIREDVFPIITSEWARCILISTLNKRSEKSWFYNVVIKWEQEEIKRSLINESPRDVINDMRNTHVQPHIDSGKPFEKWIHDIDIDEIKKEMMMRRMRVGIRFTGEDIDYWSEQERNIARNALREHPTSYYPERRGIFPEDIKTYDFESSIKPAEYFHKALYKYVVVAYDPAESRDKAAIVFIWWNEPEKKLEVFKVDKLPSNYTFHWPYIKDALKSAERYIIPQGIRAASESVFFAYDHNGVGHGLEPYFIEVGIRIDLKVKFTWWTTPNKKGRLHTIPKNYLVTITQNAFEHGSMIINQEAIDLVEEMENYRGVTNERTGNTQYGASTGSDDFVSAMMIGTYFILEYMWEKYNITKSTLEQIAANEETTWVLSDEDWNRLYIQELRKGRTIQDIQKQHWTSNLNLTRRDLLSKFGY